MKKLSALVLFIFISLQSFSQYSRGNGTMECPYIISNPGDLYQLMRSPADWDKVFRQTEHIDCQNLTKTRSIGNDSLAFTGVYLGLNYNISKLSIPMHLIKRAGLFGEIGSKGIVSGVNLEGFMIVGHDNVGALCGVNYGSISNCNIGFGTVVADLVFGGVVGQNHGTINSTYVMCSIKKKTNAFSNYYVGGFVGSNYGIIKASESFVSFEMEYTDVAGGFCGMNHPNALIENCKAKGNIKATECIGGFCGIAKRSKILNCHSKTGVCATEGKAGGFIGYSEKSEIRNCTSSGSAISEKNHTEAGGFCSSIKGGIIANCVSRGNVSAQEICGGFIGESFRGKIVNCLAFGNVYGLSQIDEFIAKISPYCRITNSYSCDTQITHTPLDSCK